jgi:2,3,4,5-tetrahydropyridine-2-carboxylate N-succinyltransferase
MSFADQIESYWTNRELLKEESAKNFIQDIIEELDKGRIRVAEPQEDGSWLVNEALKKAIILYFPIQQMQVSEVGIFEYHDKMKLKTGYDKLGVRVVPPAVARYGAYISKGVVLMPSYVNIGAYIDEGTMVDTWATVGSCAQIGKNVHLSGGVGDRRCAGTCAGITCDY